MLTTHPRIVAVAVLTFVAGILLGGYVVSAPSMNELQKDGDRMIAALVKYRHEHGACPASAADAGVQLPDTRYGRWKYHASSDRKSFELSVGEYTGLDPFTLFWSSEDGRWRRDQ